jgi:hypothetical protein
LGLFNGLRPIQIKNSFSPRSGPLWLQSRADTRCPILVGVGAAKFVIPDDLSDRFWFWQENAAGMERSERGARF